MSIDLQVDKIFELLSSDKNVLLLGAPATGKSRVMALVAERFNKTTKIGVALEPSSAIPFPPSSKEADKLLPSPDRENRKVISITFHQGTKHRQFVSGIIPRLLAGESGFRITKGVLLEANEYAISQIGATLLCIDEINRGPAVSVFGDTLTAIERDKRLNEDDKVLSTSASFQAYDDTTGDLEPVYLSPHVYILASMNEADTSVEPLDVAFLRRFAVFRLEPNAEVVYSCLGITADTLFIGNPLEVKHIYATLVKAWLLVNQRISLGRSAAFQIGHGVLIRSEVPLTIDGAFAYAAECWRRIEAHVREVFFGNDLAQSFILNAKPGAFYEVVEADFGDQSILKLLFRPWSDDNIFKLLTDVITDTSGAS